MQFSGAKLYYRNKTRAELHNKPVVVSFLNLCACSGEFQMHVVYNSCLPLMGSPSKLMKIVEGERFIAVLLLLYSMVWDGNNLSDTYISNFHFSSSSHIYVAVELYEEE